MPRTLRGDILYPPDRQRRRSSDGLGRRYSQGTASVSNLAMMRSLTPRLQQLAFDLAVPNWSTRS